MIDFLTYVACRVVNPVTGARAAAACYFRLTWSVAVAVWVSPPLVPVIVTV
jgi:hypothetical protein